MCPSWCNLLGSVKDGDVAYVTGEADDDPELEIHFNRNNYISGAAFLVPGVPA